MPTVCMNPYPTGPDQGDGGVRRVVEALIAGLPAHGWQVTSRVEGADLIANHGALCLEAPGVPMVSHCHGLYWREHRWPGWADRINGAVTHAMLRADAVTAPSEWVANAIRRGSLLDPEVVYHGVNAAEWEPAESLGYVLWNKARVDAVSDPRAVAALAERLPHLPFVTTHGGGGHTNVQQIGSTDYTQMREIVRRAGVYLATVRETFGIGTLEALAAGVPIVGWDFAGQREIVTPNTGVLVPEGDYDALAKAVEWALQDRVNYSRAARADAIARWGWEARIAQYAALYDRVLAAHRAERPRVSVVITSYNLNRYLPEAYASAQGADEVIVVDDCGTEDARAVLPEGARVERPPQNLGLSGARNYGAARATGEYLLFLDADDMLAPGALGRLAAALDGDAGIHVAYGGLDLVDERGGNRRPNPWPGDCQFRAQAAHLNQLHYSALWRREAFVRTGGYRTRDWRAEDASLWLRAMGQGIRVARVTSEATLLYRVRADSKSQEEARAFADRDGDWTHWLPWRAGAASGPEGAMLARDGIRLVPGRVPFSAMQPPLGTHAWPVAHHAKPLVSVIIPVGPGHASYLVDALDSLQAQTFDAWEAIVVNDSGADLPPTGHAWARILTTPGKQGAGYARNIGLEAASSPLALFLDADDMLTPDALETLLAAYAQADATFVYSDVAHWQGRWDSDHETLPAPEFDQAGWLAQSQTKLALPAVSMLIETEAARAVGFDATFAGWEDGVFYLDLAARGYCGRRVPRALLLYRVASGERRKISHKQASSLMKTIGARFRPVVEGTMPKRSCCGGNAPTVTLAHQALAPAALEPAPEAAAPAGTVRLKYTGPLAGTFRIVGKPSGKAYEAGNNPFHRYVNVAVEDVAFMRGQEGFEVVER
jgi:glycosyltransferase involved in cell wall biosynthesis